ncbi:MAG TPA: hypothetical protein VM840_13595 [Actinomycetota bacterium]|nr:hypothetical protein [Actinomycetota bacterium]
MAERILSRNPSSTAPGPISRELWGKLEDVAAQEDLDSGGNAGTLLVEAFEQCMSLGLWAGGQPTAESPSVPPRTGNDYLTPSVFSSFLDLIAEEASRQVGDTVTRDGLTCHPPEEGAREGEPFYCQFAGRKGSGELEAVIQDADGGRVSVKILLYESV